MPRRWSTKAQPARSVALAAVAEPAAIDPRWNRTLALAWEQRSGEEDDGLSHAERRWRLYLEDLAGLECLSPNDRRLAQALVWSRLGRMLTFRSAPLCATCRVRHEPDRELQRRAVECFRNSLRLAPQLLATHQALAQAYREWDQPSKEATALKRLLKRFPEHLETLLSLAEHHLGRDEPLAAREFAFRARQLKPLDAKIKELVWGLHLACARHYAPGGPVGRGARGVCRGGGGRPRRAPTVCPAGGVRGEGGRFRPGLRARRPRRGTNWASRPRSGS